jgi:hypothetical protein
MTHLDDTRRSPGGLAALLVQVPPFDTRTAPPTSLRVTDTAGFAEPEQQIVTVTRSGDAGLTTPIGAWA